MAKDKKPQRRRLVSKGQTKAVDRKANDRRDTSLKAALAAQADQWLASPADPDLPDVSESHEYRRIRYLAEHGTEFTGFTPAAELPETRTWQKRRRPKAKECFYNSQKFCFEYENAQYWEGRAVVVPGLPPVAHAWVVFQGRLFDFTLEADGSSPGTAWYVGIHIPTLFAARSWANRVSGSLLFDYLLTT